jgi:hypothetical protein
MPHHDIFNFMTEKALAEPNAHSQFGGLIDRFLDFVKTPAVYHYQDKDFGAFPWVPSW